MTKKKATPQKTPSTQKRGNTSAVSDAKETKKFLTALAVVVVILMAIVYMIVTGVGR
jgi:hypothetical protein